MDMNKAADLNTSFKPQGYSTISPFFVTKEADNFASFIIEVFDAEQISRFVNDDGTAYHLELKIGDTVLMISEATDEFPANRALTHIYVQDASGVFDKAIKNGAAPIQEPVIAEGDTDKRGMFEDISGNIWAVATHNTLHSH